MKDGYYFKCRSTCVVSHPFRTFYSDVYATLAKSVGILLTSSVRSAFTPVQVFGTKAKLEMRLPERPSGSTSRRFSPPEPQEGSLVIAHDDAVQAGREVSPLKLPFHPDTVFLASILVDQARSFSWEKRYVKVAGVAPVKLLDEARERLAALLQID